MEGDLGVSLFRRRGLPAVLQDLGSCVGQHPVLAYYRLLSGDCGFHLGLPFRVLPRPKEDLNDNNPADVGSLHSPANRNG
jgi:hypothetical protein